MSERCETCADWKRMAPPDADFGECWSGDRLDGDLSKGPAGTPRGDGVCEAWRATRSADGASPAERPLSPRGTE